MRNLKKHICFEIAVILITISVIIIGAVSANPEETELLGLVDYKTGTIYLKDDNFRVCFSQPISSFYGMVKLPRNLRKRKSQLPENVKKFCGSLPIFQLPQNGRKRRSIPGQGYSRMRGNNQAEDQLGSGITRSMSSSTRKIQERSLAGSAVIADDNDSYSDSEEFPRHRYNDHQQKRFQWSTNQPMISPRNNFPVSETRQKIGYAPEMDAANLPQLPDMNSKPSLKSGYGHISHAQYSSEYSQNTPSRYQGHSGEYGHPHRSYKELVSGPTAFARGGNSQDLGPYPQGSTVDLGRGSTDFYQGSGSNRYPYNERRNSGYNNAQDYQYQFSTMQPIMVTMPPTYQSHYPAGYSPSTVFLPQSQSLPCCANNYHYRTCAIVTFTCRVIVENARMCRPKPQPQERTRQICCC